jgi:hypothetical protein
MQQPVGRPGRPPEQKLVGAPGDGLVGVDAIMAELIDVGIPFVGNPLAIAIDIQPAQVALDLAISEG